MSQEKQPKLILILNQLEKIFSKEQLSAQKQKQIKQKVNEVIFYLDQNLNKLGESVVMQVLEFLNYYSEKFNFVELFHDYKQSYLVNINLAYIIQQRWKSQKFNELTPNTSQILNAIRVIKEVRSDLDKDDEESYYEFMKFDFVLTKSYLQLAASYSQFNDHKKALSHGKSSIKFLQSLCNKIEAILTKHSTLGFEFSNMKKVRKLINENQDLFNQFMSFFNITKKVNNYFNKIFPSLVSNENEPFEFDFGKFEQIPIKQDMKFLKPIWIDQISLSNFMHVEYIQMEKINIDISFTEIFSTDFLSILISLTSIIYFLISTENRLNLITQFQYNQNENFKIKNLFEKNHYEKVKKMKRYVFSEILHGKAVNILQAYFQRNPVLTHLTNSYMKNYKTNIQMEQIQEIEQDYSNHFQSGTGESFVEYSFDISNLNQSISIVNPFKPYLQQIVEEPESTQVSQKQLEELAQTLSNINQCKMIIEEDQKQKKEKDFKKLESKLGKLVKEQKTPKLIMKKKSFRDQQITQVPLKQKVQDQKTKGFKKISTKVKNERKVLTPSVQNLRKSDFGKELFHKKKLIKMKTQIKETKQLVNHSQTLKDSKKEKLKPKKLVKKDKSDLSKTNIDSLFAKRKSHFLLLNKQNTSQQNVQETSKLRKKKHSFQHLSQSVQKIKSFQEFNFYKQF